MGYYYYAAVPQKLFILGSKGKQFSQGHSVINLVSLALRLYRVHFPSSLNFLY